MARRKVKITIDGSKGSRVTAAGGTVADGVTPGELPGGQGADVELDLTNLDGDEITAAGDHVLRYQQVSEPLDELAQILAAALTKGQADDLREIIADIKTQAQKPEEERNQSKLKRLLDGIGDYIGVAALAVTQAGQVQQLFTMVKGLLGMG